MKKEVIYSNSRRTYFGFSTDIFPAFINSRSAAKAGSELSLDRVHEDEFTWSLADILYSHYLGRGGWRI
jgi:hypothetical protein